MLFFFKEKPEEIVMMIDPAHYFALEYSPAMPAKKIFPQWWKDTASSKFNWDILDVTNTAKSCVGIINQLSYGIIMPIWCDLAIQWDEENYRYQFSDRRTEIHLHNSPLEVPGFLSDHYLLKIKSPWVIKSKVKLQYQFPFYHHPVSPNYTITPGIITPQKGYCGSNVFLCLKKEKTLQNLMIKTNTPLMQIVPLTDKKVVYRFEVMSEKDHFESRNSMGCPNHFTSRGLKNIHHEEQGKK
jgi:hypothetical protein